MRWPLSQDYNEAIQCPRGNFSDPDLQKGEAATNPLGIPLPRSGNFADVYEMRCPSGDRWAVKCFTREVPGLRERYAAISRHLAQAQLPFIVYFTFLEQGIRVRGQWFPILKMQWVEGLTLNEFVRQNADKPPMLNSLLQIWVRMASRLREADIAHADLQHGNVLLVPGLVANALALKLVDYDGMFVPALAGSDSGEVGHPCYQHPERLAERTYSLEVDRFPLLLIAAALSCLKMAGRNLWDKYNSGDNLLFREADLRTPVKSPLFCELLKLADPQASCLVGRTLDALKGRLESVPLLEEVLPELHVPRAPKSAIPKRTAVAKPTLTRPGTAPHPTVELVAASSASPWDFVDEEETRSRRKGRSRLPRWVASAVIAGVAAMVLAGGIFALKLGSEEEKQAEKRKDETRIAQNQPKKLPLLPEQGPKGADPKQEEPEGDRGHEDTAEPRPPDKQEESEPKGAGNPIKREETKTVRPGNNEIKELPPKPNPISSAPDEVLTPAQAAGKEGKKVTVKSRVQSTGGNPAGFAELYSEPAWNVAGNFFIRFHKSNLKKFQDLGIPDVARHFQGKLIQVTGIVTKIGFGGPLSFACIEVKDPAQIWVPDLPTPRTEEAMLKPAASSSNRARDNHPLDVKEKAAEDYVKACSDARAKLLKAFDTAMRQLEKGSEKRRKLVETVKEEKERFENRGLIPWSQPLRRDVDRYLKELGSARDKLVHFYNSRIKAQLQAKKESKAADLEAELKDRLDIRVMGKWQRSRNGAGIGIVTLYSNGKINNPDGNATWNYDNGVLYFKWPAPRAPGGAWIDIHQVSEDGTTFEGTNNDRPQNRPKLTGVYVPGN